MWTDYRRAIDEAEADAVIIVIPTIYHVDAARRALAAGMHVLSEKPLAHDLASAIVIRDEARRHPTLTYAVSQNYRWRAHNQTLKRAVTEGAIGNPGALALEFRQPEMLLGARASLAMPLLEDVSIHHFDLIRYLLDANAIEVFARSYRPPWSRFNGLPGTEAVITMDSGAVVGYSGTWAARGRYTLWEGEISITGSHGSVTLDAAGDVRCFADAGPTDSFTGFEPKQEAGVLLPLESVGRTELDETLDQFLLALQGGTPASTRLEDNFHSYAMVAAAVESARTGHPVHVAP